MKHHRKIGIFLMILSIAWVAPARSAAQGGNISMPSNNDLNEGWNILKPGRCNPNSKTFGLRNAIVGAYNGKVHDLDLPLSVQELNYTASEKMGKNIQHAALEYSNHPNTGLEDVLELQNDVKLKIEADLDRPLFVNNAEEYKATIRRTAYGVAHIEADDLGSLGFGEGFAQAEDHLCTIADQIVMVTGERAKYFGRGEQDAHVMSDLAMRGLRILKRASEELAKQPTELREWAEGFAAGYNHYLAKARRDAMPGWCKSAEWVRPITVEEIAALWKVRKFMTHHLASMITSAQPPTETSESQKIGASLTPEMDILGYLPQERNASNGWALGRERTENGRGMLLANPHYNWTGSNRFWEKHLRIPGKLDVYGVNLIGDIGVGIGFNEAVGWTHTASSGDPFTLYSLDLVAGDPTTYRYGAEVRKMTPIEISIEILGEAEPLKRTMWTTHYGPVVNAGPLKWTLERAFTIRDATEDNLGTYGHLLHTSRATSVKALQEVHAKYQALPTINTIAADAQGAAWFSNAPSIPNLSDMALAQWRENLKTDSLTRVAWGARFMLVDGSDPHFEWQQDNKAARAGIVPFHRIPQLERTDYVFNSNNSFWLSNADTLLEGNFSPLHGPQGLLSRNHSPRTRSNLIHITNNTSLLPAGEDGRFSLTELQDVAFSNRSFAADLLVPELVERCRANPRISLDGQEVDLRSACSVLAQWDRRFNLDSRGAVLFREWITRYAISDLSKGGKLFAVDFDPGDPINTPHTLAKGKLALENLARAVKLLENKAISLDVPLGDLQFVPSKLPHRMAVHGGYEHEGVLNLMIPDLLPTSLEPVEIPTTLEGSPFLTGSGYPIFHGTSFIMALEFTDEGPRANALLTYGQSGDPASEHFLDQTKLFQRKEWRPILFKQDDIDAGTIRRYEVGAERPKIKF
ncbi:MAG TPA: penicillin acylase family protein [Phnomibacter sp.]|nr:penicillin acylase family protein [Phnomibacter sp.]